MSTIVQILESKLYTWFVHGPQGQRGGGVATKQWLVRQNGTKELKKFYCPEQGTSNRDERRALGYMGVAATMWVLISAEVAVLSSNDHRNPSQGRRKSFGKSQSFENFQVPLGSVNKNNFGAFRVPMARAAWAWQPLRGSPCVLRYPYCHQ